MDARSVERRFRSGDACGVAGQYCFDGFVGVPARESPPRDERVIWVEPGASFPPAPRGGPCWWVSVGAEPSLADDVGLEAIHARCLG